MLERDAAMARRDDDYFARAGQLRSRAARQRRGVRAEQIYFIFMAARKSETYILRPFASAIACALAKSSLSAFFSCSDTGLLRFASARRDASQDSSFGWPDVHCACVRWRLCVSLLLAPTSPPTSRARELDVFVALSPFP